MTSNNQAPQRVWIIPSTAFGIKWNEGHYTDLPQPNRIEYTRSDLLAAKDAEIRCLREALVEYMVHDADYAAFNNLGDHTESHRWKRALAALDETNREDTARTDGIKEKGAGEEPITAAIWTDGKRTVKGRWRYVRASDIFVIEVDEPNHLTGETIQVITTHNDVPEWGNFTRLKEQADG